MQKLKISQTLKVFIAYLTLVLASDAFALKVTTSITPIASLISMVGGNKVEINILSQGGKCIHHYQLTPSQIKEIRESGLIIYFDDNLDYNDLFKHNSRTYKLNLNNNTKKGGMYIWLNVESSIKLVERIYDILSSVDSANREYYRKNLKASKLKLANFGKNLKLKAPKHDFSKVLLLTDSLSELTNYLNLNIAYYKTGKTLSLKTLDYLKSMGDKLFIIDLHQNINNYTAHFKNVKQVDVENWAIETDLSNVYYSNLTKIVKDLYGI